MSLKTKVKAGNITNLSDARYCAGMGVDWLSFPADVVNPTAFKEITDWVTGPQLILEIKSNPSQDVINQYPVTILEIPLSEIRLMDNFPAFSWVISFPISAWHAHRNELLSYKGRIVFLVVDLDEENEQAIADIASQFKVLIHYSDKQVLNSLMALPIEGINVTGEDELKPGLKDFDKLASVLEELEIVD